MSVSGLNLLRDRFSDNPLDLIRKLQIVDQAGKLSSLEDLYEEQLSIIKSILSLKSLVVLKSRQIGSSTAVCAAFFLLWLLSEHPTRTIILSHKQKSSKVLLRKVRMMYETLPDVVKKLRPCKITETQMTLLDTGAEIMCCGAGDKGGIRSFTCDRLLLSELAFSERADELMASAVASVNQGQLVIESTPNFYGDALHKEIDKIETGLLDRDFLFFPWTMHKKYQDEDAAQDENFTLSSEEAALNLSPSQASWRRRRRTELGPVKFQREYPISVQEAYAQLPNSFISLQDMSPVGKMETQKDVICWHREASASGIYTVGADVGLGRGGDFSSAHVLDCRTMEVMATYRSNVMSPTLFASVLTELSVNYNSAVINCESNSMGEATVAKLAELGRTLFLDRNGKVWTTGKSNKATLLELVRSKVCSQAFKALDDFTWNELVKMTVDRYGRPEDNPSIGSHFDGVISLGLALVAAEAQYIPKREEVIGLSLFRKKRPLNQGGFPSRT